MPSAFYYSTVPTNSPKGSAFAPILDTIISPGSIQMYAGATSPDGWLICDGSTVSRTIYSNLFKAIGTTYGAGDSNKTFTLPDFRGRSPLGVGTGTGLTARTLGSNVGAETATMTESTMASHSHTTTVGLQSANHTHTGTSGDQSVTHTHSYGIPIGTTGASYGMIDSLTATSSGLPYFGGASAGHTHSTTFGTESSTHSHTVTNANTGSGTAFSIMPPSIAVNFIIKT